MHKKKIDMADSVFVINKNNYKSLEYYWRRPHLNSVPTRQMISTIICYMLKHGINVLINTLGHYKLQTQIQADRLPSPPYIV